MRVMGFARVGRSIGGRRIAVGQAGSNIRKHARSAAACAVRTAVLGQAGEGVMVMASMSRAMAMKR